MDCPFCRKPITREMFRQTPLEHMTRCCLEESKLWNEEFRLAEFRPPFVSEEERRLLGR